MALLFSADITRLVTELTPEIARALAPDLVTTIVPELVETLLPRVVRQVMTCLTEGFRLGQWWSYPKHGAALLMVHFSLPTPDFGGCSASFVQTEDDATTRLCSNRVEVHLCRY